MMRIGIKQNKLKLLQIALPVIQISISILGLLAVIGSYTENPQTLNTMRMRGIALIMLYGPLLWRINRPPKVRYVEMTDEGIRQGKKVIPWHDLLQIVWAKKKYLRKEDTDKHGYFYFEGRNGDWVSTLFK